MNLINWQIIVLILFCFILGFFSCFVIIKIIYKNQSIFNNTKSLANFLNFFVKSLADSENIKDIILIIINFLKEKIKLSETLVLFCNDKNGFDILNKSSNFPNIYYLGIIKKGKQIKISNQGVLANVVNNKQILHLPYESLRELFELSLLINCKSLVAIPLILKGDLRGIACFTQKNRKKFSNQQIKDLQIYSNYILLSKNYMESYIDSQEKKNLTNELQIARQIQVKLMPIDIPDVGDFSIVAMNHSAKYVSGDFYDFINISENKILVVIGDASGKGVPACIIGVMARSIIRSLVVQVECLNDILLRLNDSLYNDLDQDRFITIGFVLIDKKQNIIECARAGHTAILFKSNENKIVEIKPKGVAIGLLPRSKTTVFETFSMIFPQGCEMMLFSDGLLEQINDKDEEFGIERLRNSWFYHNEKSNKINQVAEGILAEVKAYAGDIPVGDDQTLILISKN